MEQMPTSSPVSPMSCRSPNNNDNSSRSFVVVVDPSDEQAYSISLRYVLPTAGLDHVLEFLTKNTQRKHKKHVQLPLCQSVVLGTPCALRNQCSEIHVTHEGYAKRRLWVRPLTIQRLTLRVAERRQSNVGQSSTSSDAEALANSPAHSPVDGSYYSLASYPSFAEGLSQMPFQRVSSFVSIGSSIPPVYSPVSSLPNLTGSFVFPTTPTTVLTPSYCYDHSPYSTAISQGFHLHQTDNTLHANMSFSPTYANLGQQNTTVGHWDEDETKAAFSQLTSTDEAGSGMSMPTIPSFRPKVDMPTYRPRLCSTPMIPLPRLGLDVESSPEQANSDENRPQIDSQPASPVDSPANSMQCATPRSKQSISPETSPARMVFVHSPYEPILPLSLPSSPRKPMYPTDAKTKQPAKKFECGVDGASWADIDPDEEMDFQTSINTFIKQPSSIFPLRRGSL